MEIPIHYYKDNNPKGGDLLLYSKLRPAWTSISAKSSELAQHPKTQRIGSIGFIALGILEVQELARATLGLRGLSRLLLRWLLLQLVGILLPGSQHQQGRCGTDSVDHRSLSPYRPHEPWNWGHIP